MGTWVFLLTLIWHVIGTTVEQDASYPEDFEAELHKAAVEVLSQDHLNVPPEFNMPPSFMRSYVPNTGVGNREELLIASVNYIPVFDDGISKWRYQRFNNSDYILGVNSHNAVLRKVDTITDEYFVFSKEGSIFSFVSDYRSAIVDVIMFTCSVHRSEVLYLAILTESVKSSIINIYEIVEDKGVPVTLIDLGVSPSESYFAKKLAYVQSGFGSSLVVLIATADFTEVVYQQKGSSELNHYIAVYYPAAVDLITFKIHGHGYIAVANSTEWEILKMDEFTRNHIIFDRSMEDGIINFEYFRLGFLHYFVVSTTNVQRLYIWKSSGIFLKQELHDSGVNQIYAASVPTCRDDVLLFLLRSEATEIYVFSGEQEAFYKIENVLPPNFVIHASSVTSFVSSNILYLLHHDYRGSQILAIRTDLRPLADPVLASGKRISDLMESLQAILDDQTKQIQQISEVLVHAVRANGDQRITSYQYFKDISTSNETIVKSFEEPIRVQWDGSDLSLDEYKTGTDKLERDVAELENLLNNIEYVIPDVVQLDENVLITGLKTFSGDVTGTEIEAFSLNLQSAAGINVKEVQDTVYRIDKPQKIEGTLTFQRPLVVTGDIDVEKVNGIDISADVMTTNTKQTSSARMFFENKLTINGDLDLSGKLNDIVVRDEVVTLHGNHSITGIKSFQNGIIAENVDTVLLDGVDINDIKKTAFTISGDQTISSTKTFLGGVYTNNITMFGYLNGYDVLDLAENIVRVDKPASIAGHKIFLDDVTIDGHLTVNGTVNGLHIPDDLFLVDRTQIVTGNKVFNNKVIASNVQVVGKIDGLSLPDDIVTLTGDEDISSTLYFTDGISVENDIIVHGLVDGVDISELARDALKIDETIKLENAVFLGSVEIAGNIAVNGTVNKIPFQEYINDIVFKNEQRVVITGEKHFSKVTADAVKLNGMINGFNIKEDFMFVNEDQTISGTKTFKQPVTFNGVVVDSGMIDGVDIARLYENRLSLSAEQEINSDIKFTENVIVDDLIIHGAINGLRIPDDVVLKNSNHPIANKVFTNQVKVGTLYVSGNAEVSNSFAGVNLTRFYQDRITLSRNQEIVGDLWLGNVTASKIHISGLVDGVDLRAFAANVMSLTKDQTVTALKEFTGNVTIHGSITTEAGINGVDLADLKSRAFKVYEDNYVTQPFEFGDVIMNDMKVDGFINGINITQLDEDSLKTKGLQYVTGTNVFTNGFHVEGDIQASTVNGMVIPEDVLLKTFPQEITGQYTFGSMIVGGDLNVKGFVNGLDISETVPLVAKTGEENVIESNIVFKAPIHVAGDIAVTGTVNGVDLKQLYNEVLRKDGDQVVTGNKIFRGNVEILGDVEVDFVNGIPWKDFINDVVRIDRPQVIHSRKVMNDVEVRDNVTVRDTAIIGSVNGVDFGKFLEDVVLIDEPAVITGTKLFSSTVAIAKDMNATLINRLRLKDDVITLANGNDVQVITGEKTFEDVTMFADIQVDATVNGHNLREAFLDTLSIHGDQTVSGRKIFKAPTMFKKDVHSDTVNGFDLSKDVVTLHTDQEIYGPLIFKGDVTVEKNLNISGLLNEIDFEKLSREAVYLGTDQVIEGSYTIQNALAKSNVIVEGDVSGINLPVFDRNVTEFWKSAEVEMKMLEKESDDTCEITKYLHGVLESSYYVLDGFALHQDLLYPASYVETRLSNLSLRTVFANDLAFTGTAISYLWNHAKEKFTAVGKNDTQIASTFPLVIGNSKLKIHIGIDAKDSSVTVNDLPTPIPRGFKDATFLLTKFQDLIIALLFPTRGVIEMYKISTNAESHTPIIEMYGSVAVGAEARSMALFEISKVIYLAVSCTHKPPFSKGSSKIYAFKNNWILLQNIAAPVSSYVKHFHYHGYHYLAFTNAVPVYEAKEPMSVQVYRNAGPGDLPFALFQKVLFDDARGIEVFKFGSLSEIHMTVWNKTLIQVFRAEGESGFNSLFTIHGECIQAVKPLVIEQKIYMVVAQQNRKSNNIVSTKLYKGLTQGAALRPRNFKFCP